MKLILAATSLLASASAFTGPTKVAVESSLAATKVVKSKAAPVVQTSSKKGLSLKPPASKPDVTAGLWDGGATSLALPFTTAPVSLDGSLVGDAGFDPLGLSVAAASPRIKGIGGPGFYEFSDLQFLREAEIMHGRICQLAVVGFVAPGFGTLSGNEKTGLDAYSYTNPLEAVSHIPTAATVQILLFMALLEIIRIRIVNEEGASHIPGDLRLGQGEGRWNPFNFDYSPEKYAERQLNELKHGRLAMIGFLGVYFQACYSGESVVDQLSAAFTAPEYYAKAGYFLPEGI
jgi:hypothetical protein